LVQKRLKKGKETVNKGKEMVKKDKQFTFYSLLLTARKGDFCLLKVSDSMGYKFWHKDKTDS